MSRFSKMFAFASRRSLTGTPRKWCAVSKDIVCLEGYRGHPPADIAAIEDLLLRIARLVEEVPQIAELDLNPVIALPPGHGCQIVDARIRVV